MKIRYLTIILILLLTSQIQPTSGLVLDIPSTDKIEVNINTTSKQLTYKVTKNSGDQGWYGWQVTHRKASTIFVTKYSMGQWLSGVSFKLDVIKKLDAKFNLNVIINDAQQTKEDPDKGRYLLFIYKFYAKSFFENDEQITDTRVEVRIWKEHHPSGGNGFIDVPISNIYIITLIFIALVFRKRINVI